MHPSAQRRGDKMKGENMKRTVEIEDNLEEIVDGCIDDVKTLLFEYLDNTDTEEAPDVNDLDYSGGIHEIIDGSVPVYTHEIEGLFYLYGAEFEAAFDDAGCGDKEDKCWPCGWKPAAIYFYIEQKVNEWYRESGDELLKEWREANDKKKAI
jgi:hypothetical protein